ncbi:hypothetical protein, partial [Ralstonia solanacearum]|uniref:hypothetical protein n=1 Tax=Ralstonia solanacearum TaxID=305 RepID=UPI001E61BEB6
MTVPWQSGANHWKAVRASIALAQVNAALASVAKDAKGLRYDLAQKGIVMGRVSKPYRWMQ